MEPKFYEKDFISTAIEEIDFIRSPYYDYAVHNTMSSETSDRMFEDFGLKFGMIGDLQ